MKPKTLVILLVILVVLAGAGALLMYSQDAGSPSGAMGAVLFEELPANEIASIVIETPTTAVSLKKEPDGWVVAERDGYPADFAKIADFVRKLKAVKVGRKFDAPDEVLRRLSLKAPGDGDVPEGEKGTAVRMTDGEGAMVLEMTLGSTRQQDPEKGPPDGQYIMVSGSPQVYLIDTILSSFETGPAEWLEKSPVKVAADDIRRITCRGPGGTDVRYVFERPEKGKDFELKAPETDRPVKRSSLNRLSNALSSLKISDVQPASDMKDALKGDTSPRIDYALFDGRIVHVYTGEACSAGVPCLLRFEVGFEPPETPKIEPESEKSDEPAEKAGKGDAKTEPSTPEEAAKENDRLTPWIFTIPEWQHQAFFVDLDELLEAPAEKSGTKRMSDT